MLSNNEHFTIFENINDVIYSATDKFWYTEQQYEDQICPDKEQGIFRKGNRNNIWDFSGFISSVYLEMTTSVFVRDILIRDVNISMFDLLYSFLEIFLLSILRLFSQINQTYLDEWDISNVCLQFTSVSFSSFSVWRHFMRLSYKWGAHLFIRSR